MGKIALKLKPEIEAKAKANQSAAGGDKFTEKPLSATLPEAVSAVDTRKELAEAVGLGERTMGKVMQIDENAPDAIKEALDTFVLSGKSRSVIRGIGRETLKPLQKEVSPMKTKTPKKRGVER